MTWPCTQRIVQIATLMLDEGRPAYARDIFVVANIQRPHNARILLGLALAFAAYVVLRVQYVSLL